MEKRIAKVIENNYKSVVLEVEGTLEEIQEATKKYYGSMEYRIVYSKSFN